jgi:hypothetical protein
MAVPRFLVRLRPIATISPGAQGPVRDVRDYTPQREPSVSLARVGADPALTNRNYLGAEVVSPLFSAFCAAGVPLTCLGGWLPAKTFSRSNGIWKASATRVM